MSKCLYKNTHSASSDKTKVPPRKPLSIVKSSTCFNRSSSSFLDRNALLLNILVKRIIVGNGSNARLLILVHLLSATYESPRQNSRCQRFAMILGMLIPCDLCIVNAYAGCKGIMDLLQNCFWAFQFLSIGAMGTMLGSSLEKEGPL